MKVQYEAFVKLTKEYRWWNPVNIAQGLILAVILFASAFMPKMSQEADMEFAIAKEECLRLSKAC